MKRLLLTAVISLALLASTACMGVLPGIHVFVSTNGCTSEGMCPFGGQHPANFYWESTREVVLAPNQSLKILAHELCHAHQHWEVISETGRDLADPGLVKWYDTREARAFNEVAVAAQPRPWAYLSADTNLEDAATTCAMWLVAPDELRTISPERYEWARRWLDPKPTPVDATLSYYCCSDVNVGGTRFCPGDITASGHVLNTDDNGWAAACGADYAFGQELNVGGRPAVCADRGNLAANHVDLWFASCDEGRAWLDAAQPGGV